MVPHACSISASLHRITTWRMGGGGGGGGGDGGDGDGGGGKDEKKDEVLTSWKRRMLNTK